MMMHNSPLGHMGYGWVLQLIIFILFFVVMWWMIKSSQSYGFRSNANDSALDILKKRLAKGEITQKEYQKLRKEIDKD